MTWLDTAARLLIPPSLMQEREISDFPTFEAQLAAIRRSQAQARPWRAASVGEALGVPAILSAVSLISGVAGSLSMEAFRAGSLVTDPNQIPRMLLRPNPRTTAGVFWRDTAYYLATRGEAWWWIAVRDTDGAPMSLFPVPPWEITVEQNDADRLSPTIRWLNRIMPNTDMRHLTYLPDSSGLRGVGPLQLAGAAVSVTVEASNWAANFYSGNLPSMVGSTDQDLDENDLKALDAQWVEKPGNLPRWMTNGMTLAASPFDAVKAQLTESRQFQVGETARMFLVPGSLLEYQMSGSSLTYQNQADIWNDFQRRCLSPKYLEPMEQEFSDLLPRTVAGRFNLEQLLRADVKTRFETYQTGIDAGIFGPEYAQQKEGIVAGNVDFAPVPFAPPQADPGAIPMQTRSQEPIRCTKCNARVADFATPPYRFTCRKCHAVTAAAEPLQMRSEPMTLHVEATPAPIVNIAAAEAPIVNVPEQPAPIVNVHTDSFVAAIADLKDMLAAPKTRRVIRDENGRIVGVEEVAAA